MLDKSLKEKKSIPLYKCFCAKPGERLHIDMGGDVFGLNKKQAVLLYLQKLVEDKNAEALNNICGTTLQLLKIDVSSNIFNEHEENFDQTGQIVHAKLCQYRYSMGISNVTIESVDMTPIPNTDEVSFSNLVISNT